MDGWEREREMYFITIAFLEDSFCRGKEEARTEREREREGREEKRKTGEQKASGPDENGEALFACFGVVIRRERDRTRLTSQQRLFFSFFFSSFVCFFHFCFVFSFLLQERRKRRHRRRKPIPSTLRRQEQHRYYIGAFFARLKPSSPTRTVSLGTFFKIL